jgi:hypothetical protein
MDKFKTLKEGDKFLKAKIWKNKRILQVHSDQWKKFIF